MKVISMKFIFILTIIALAAVFLALLQIVGGDKLIIPFC